MARAASTSPLPSVDALARAPNPLRVAEEAATMDRVAKAASISGFGRSGLTKYYQ